VAKEMLICTAMQSS